MGFRFRRRIKIMPGISLNLSRSGVSTSVGAKGAHVTIGHDKVRTTVGLPGTGISYSDTTKLQGNVLPQNKAGLLSNPRRPRLFRGLVFAVAFS